VWPWTDANNQEDYEVFILTVDGVHCPTQEPKHPTLSKNSKFYSHKFKQAALAYEIGLSVFENRVLWMNGPFPAATHDVMIFRKALKDWIPSGKRIIADMGYIGEPGICSIPNSRDPPNLFKFKSLARSRHETFNSNLKNFKCLAECFWHGLEKHKIVFEAVCVICQYQMENGSPLFDV